MEPVVGLTQLNDTSQATCTWKDIDEFVALVRDLGDRFVARRGLGAALKGKAVGDAQPGRAARFTARLLAEAYNGMLVEGGHTIELASPDLPMKGLTGCTVLKPELLPADEAEEWAAQVPQRGAVNYPDLLVGDIRQRARMMVRLRMHRFVCYLACGPPDEADHGARHACSNKACVRPSHLR